MVLEKLAKFVGATFFGAANKGRRDVTQQVA